MILKVRVMDNNLTVVRSEFMREFPAIPSQGDYVYADSVNPEFSSPYLAADGRSARVVRIHWLPTEAVVICADGTLAYDPS